MNRWLWLALFLVGSTPLAAGPAGACSILCEKGRPLTLVEVVQVDGPPTDTIPEWAETAELRFGPSGPTRLSLPTGEVVEFTYVDFEGETP